MRLRLLPALVAHLQPHPTAVVAAQVDVDLPGPVDQGVRHELADRQLEVGCLGGQPPSVQQPGDHLTGPRHLPLVPPEDLGVLVLFDDRPLSRCPHAGEPHR